MKPIELWLDVSCPWCRGALPVIRALLSQEAALAPVLWRLVRLRPLNLAGKPLPEMSAEAVEFNRQRGRPLGVLTWLHHPQLAHRLLALCREREDVDMWGLAEEVWEANWVKAIDIADEQALAEAVSVPAEIWPQLRSGAGQQQLEDDSRRALEIGLDGVPRLYVNHTIVPAWLEPEVVRQRLAVALGKRTNEK